MREKNCRVSVPVHIYNSLVYYSNHKYLIGLLFQSSSNKYLIGPIGVNADEVHLCGEETVIDLIKHMALDTGDIVEVKR